MSDDIAHLKREVEVLRAQLDRVKREGHREYYASSLAQQDWSATSELPAEGLEPDAVKAIVESTHSLDFNQDLNTFHYVNVSLEEQEEAIALMGMRVNLADQTVYPHAYKMHDGVVNMLAHLWHCPKPDDFDENSVSLLSATQATGLLTLALAGLTPAECASLRLDALGCQNPSKASHSRPSAGGRDHFAASRQT